jgi:ankyrin repeat protein
MGWWYYRTPLAAAIQNRQIDALKLLLKYGANPNKVDGTTNALQRAIIHKYYDVMPLLLQYGGELFGGTLDNSCIMSYIFMDYNTYIHFQDIIDINQEAYGENVLWYASRYWRNIDHIKWLLDKGVDPNPPTRDPSLPILKDIKDPEIRQLLKKYGLK